MLVLGSSFIRPDVIKCSTLPDKDFDIDHVGLVALAAGGLGGVGDGLRLPPAGEALPPRLLGPQAPAVNTNSLLTIQIMARLDNTQQS